MENKDTPKPRRPLPIPNVIPAQRPNTPVAGTSPVASTSFYAGTQAPPLPMRPKNVGSSHTAAYMESPPPAYGPGLFSNSPGYREPELIAEDPITENDRVSTLMPQEVDMNRDWSREMGPTPYDPDTWQNTPAPIWGTQGYDSWSAGGGGSGFDAMDYQSPVYSAKSVTIDGRNLDEEASWWDASVREINNRPGPGILPPVLANELHNPDHSLFSVSVTSPNLHSTLPRSSIEPQRKPSSSAPTHTPSSSQSSSTPPPPPPTDDDVRTAVPHPNAYYCPKDNGWVLLSWKSSSVAPPLARSFRSTAHRPLPDQNRRKRTGSCIGDDEQPFGQTNKTHHFHKYAKAVDAHKLTPPFRQDDWETLENVKAKRRAGTIIMEGIDLEKMKAQERDRMQEDEAEEEGKLLDLYVCCQCSFYCVASGVISGVIPRKFWEEFVRDRKSSPPPGKTGELAVVLALETLIMCV